VTRDPQRLRELGISPPPGDIEGRAWRGHSFRELRWQAELVRLLADPVFRGSGVPRGQGRTVVLVPGFLVGDWSLGILYRWLRRMGHDPHRSGLSFNADCSNRTLRRLEDKVRGVADRRGSRVTLVGHSRGGQLARALAHRRPDLVGEVFTMGTGLNALYDVALPLQRTSRVVAAIHRHTTDRRAHRGCLSMACRCDFTRHFWGDFPADVGLTSIYSRTDGLVRWPSCVVPYARCIEVRGSHVGLAVNRAVYRVLAEGLAQAPRLTAG
jgi:triacylglycerol lipase